jgi:hypothetical protein
VKVPLQEAAAGAGLRRVGPEVEALAGPVEAARADSAAEPEVEALAGAVGVELAEGRQAGPAGARATTPRR